MPNLCYIATILLLYLLCVKIIQALVPRPPNSFGTGFVLSVLKQGVSQPPEKDRAFVVDVCNQWTKDVIVNYWLYASSPKILKIDKVTVKKLTSAAITFNLLKIFTEDGLSPQVIYIEASREVSVFATNYGIACDTITAIPIDVLGTVYQIVTLRYNPVFTVVSVKSHTSVSILLKETSLALSDYVLQNRQEGQPHPIHLYLPYKYQYLELHDCRQDKKRPTDFSGTIISANQSIAVVSGNCLSGTHKRFDSHMEEMLTPLTFWGRVFFVHTPDVAETCRLQLTCQKTAAILMIKSDENGTLFGLNTVKSTLKLEVEARTDVYMSSNQPIQVVLFAFGRPGVPGSMLTIPPIFNWLNKYVFSQPYFREEEKYYVDVIIVCVTSTCLGIKINQQSVSTKSTHETFKQFSTIVSKFRSKQKSSLFVVENSNRVPFGLYICSLSPSRGIELVSGGMAFNNIEQDSNLCGEKRQPMKGEDMLDNDCDGLVDEELPNGKSDDDDDEIDEDLARVDGGWSQWSNVTGCSKMCRGRGFKVLTRLCANPEPSLNGKPCPGNSTKMLDKGKMIPCSTLHVACPNECRDGTWGFGCRNNCSRFCSGSCNKMTGACYACRRTFIIKENGVCEPGTRSLGSLTKIDSIEKKSASGDASTMMLIVLCVGMIILVPTIMVWIVVLDRKMGSTHIPGQMDPHRPEVTHSSTTLSDKDAKSGKSSEDKNGNKSSSKGEEGSDSKKNSPGGPPEKQSKK